MDNYILLKQVDNLVIQLETLQNGKFGFLKVQMGMMVPMEHLLQPVEHGQIQKTMQ